MSLAQKLATVGLDDRWKASTLAFVTSFPALSGGRSVPVFFKPDGLVFYVGGTARQYTLSSAWDLSSATLDHTTSISTTFTIFFSSDGLKFYHSNSLGELLEYNVASAWDLSSTLTLANTFSPGSTGALFFFRDDGKLLLTKNFRSYSLSTPWDTTTATLSATSTVSDDGEGLWAKPDGTKLYSGKGGTGSAVFREYTMSTPWDVTTLSLNTTSAVVDRGNFFISQDGLRLFKFGPLNIDTVDEYSMG